MGESFWEQYQNNYKESTVEVVEVKAPSKAVTALPGYDDGADEVDSPEKKTSQTLKETKDSSSEDSDGNNRAFALNDEMDVEERSNADPFDTIHHEEEDSSSSDDSDTNDDDEDKK